MVKKYGESATIGLNIPYTQNALSIQKDDAWVGYVPIIKTDITGAVPFAQIAVTLENGVHSLHFYNADGIWLCKI